MVQPPPEYHNDEAGDRNHISFADDLQTRDDDERKMYRLWREGRPMLSGRSSPTTHRSKSGDNSGRVEKKIEATLPTAEPVAATRSRKASHYLGVFKEQEQKKKEEKAKEKAAAAANERRAGEPPTPGTGSRIFSFDTSRSQTASTPSYDEGGELVATPSSVYDVRSIATSEDEHRRLASGPEPKQKQPLPLPNLEDLKALQTLTFGAEGESAFSTSLPTTETERKRSFSRKATPQSPRQEFESYFDVKSKPNELRLTGADEEDESEREQISSALYFPHRQIAQSPQHVATSPSEESPLTSPVPSQKILKSFSKESKGKWPTTSVLDKIVTTPEEVEISLQGQDEGQILHGDIPARTLPEDHLSMRLVSEPAVSDSDQDNYEDSQYGYDSTTSNADDLAATPKAAQSPKPQRTRSVHQPPAPVPAVELKPFNHQVGGHSTVYRFSRRAVCKQLNNRENEFYETVERFHPDLLEFMPRYDKII